jgi:hypothetical protein
MRNLVVNKDVPEQVMLAKTHTKELLNIVHNIKNTKDKILEGDSKLERSIIRQVTK